MSRNAALSVVVPMHNEALVLDALMARLLPVLDHIGLEAEMVCVDDGSTDDTLARLKALQADEPRVKVLALSRNFGKEAALAAGLRRASGQAVILMDADLQHPPELLERFVSLWREGWPVVYGQRRTRDTDTWIRRWAARMFYRLFGALSQTPLPPGAGDFRLMDRRAVDALNALAERTRFTKGLYAWIGFRSIAVPFDVGERAGGRSGWRLGALWRFAVDAITAFSTLPLRIWTYVGTLVSLGALLYAAHFFVRTLVYGVDLPGFPSLIIAITFFAGVQLIGLGIIGEYLGRVFTEVKQRPLYLVAEEHGFPDAPPDHAAPDSRPTPGYTP
ncbi:glycosyltransferase family 2 protein [Pararhodospirillum oryzae]|uniref:Glycosyl transferase n=1 Tax=Pararhodospirillum oryzae TaxID=478448 RepID=A0A512H5N6_9PROT|nr:glycosyltransferase family 2 protein [Pararhodospirillum oryzae]GEO80785.1 glycosyl transferase [Pararhodospirillum oryzae]